jgi:hypothetical protein
VPFLTGVLLAALPGSAEVRVPLDPHPELRNVSAAPCDHVFRAVDKSPDGTGALEDWLDDPALGDTNGDGSLVFCLEPGVDYRSDEENDKLQIRIARDCSPDTPCILRPDWAAPEHPHRQPAGERVILPALELAGSSESKLSHWRLQGLTVRPRIHPRRTAIRVTWTDDSILDLLWIDFGPFNPIDSSGVIEGVKFSIDSDRNVLERSLITDCPDLGTDVNAISFFAHYEAGVDSEDNLVIDNEVRDCSAVVFATAAVPLDTNRGGFRASGLDCVDHATAPTQKLRSWAIRTRVENNEGYVTPDAYFDCNYGPPIPPLGGVERECACKEAPFESKHRPPPGHENHFRFNRAWGSRPGEQWHCGGSGSNAGAFQSGNACDGSATYVGNVAWDAPMGLSTGGDGVVFAGNLVLDPVIGGGVTEPRGIAFWTGSETRGFNAYRNVMVRAVNSFSHRGSDMDVRCNTTLDPLNEGRVLGPRGSNVTTQSNFFYGDETFSDLTFNLTDCSDGADGDGCPEEPDDHLFDDLDSANMERVCFETRRWTGPRWVCFEEAFTTGSSPHSGTQPECVLGSVAPILAANFPLGLSSETTPPTKLESCEPMGSGELRCYRSLDFTAAPEPSLVQLQLAALVALGALWTATRRRPWARRPGRFTR